MKGELKQDEKYYWWYYAPCGVRKQYYERKCECGKVDIVDKKHLNKKCKSCTYIGHELSKKTKLKISESHKGKTASKETKKKLSEARRGKNNPNYIGRVKNNMGYINIYAPEHPNSTKAGYVLEHRLIMENMIGRPLKPYEVVHHINGIKYDNRPSNLWLFNDASEHSIFHAGVEKFTKKPHYIYTAGNISNDSRTHEWRETVEILLKKEALYKRVVFVNPSINEFDKGLDGTKTDQIQILKDTTKQTQKILRAKDYKMIKMCSILIVNLEIYNTSRPMIGTLQELVWAHDIFYIPVIAITGPPQISKDNPYVQHVWIDECCSAKVNTVEEAAQMVKTFFLEY